MVKLGLRGSWMVGSGLTLVVRPGGGGRALGHRLEAPQQLLAVVARGRPQVELGGGVLGDDVGLIPALGDHPVDARVGLDLLPLLVERDEELDHRVQRVDPAPGPRRRMRGLAEELDLDLDDAQARPPDLGARAARGSSWRRPRP